MHVSSRKGFTLIELLVVIAIIAVLAVVVVLTLNPAELLRQARDSNRLSDMSTLVHAIGIYQEDLSTGSMGSASTTYLSIPDANATTTAGDACQALGMSTSTTWHCASSSYYRNINATGWLPINFASTSAGSPLGSLPIDPTNNSSSNLFYTYQTNGTQYEVTATMESQKYQSVEANDGGTYSDLFEQGTKLVLAAMDFGGGSGSSATGTVTQANMRLSTINGTAFVDFSVSVSLTPYIGDKLTVSDSAGHHLIGWIKAAGTGETYGSELLTNPAMDTLGSFALNNVTTTILSTGCQSGNCLQVKPTSAYGSAYQYLSSITSGWLLRTSAYLKAGTETNFLGLSLSNASYVVITPTTWVLPATWTQYVLYATADSTASNFTQSYQGATVGKTSLFDSASVQQVLTPSTTGVTIVSTAGGSIYNWMSEDSGFNRNDSGGYTYAITSS
jgi:prepilin-type N-terminal cleavage/methylation domain-containing protein